MSHVGRDIFGDAWIDIALAAERRIEDAAIDVLTVTDDGKEDKANLAKFLRSVADRVEGGFYDGEVEETRAARKRIS